VTKRIPRIRTKKGTLSSTIRTRRKKENTAIPVTVGMSGARSVTHVMRATSSVTASCVKQESTKKARRVFAADVKRDTQYLNHAIEKQHRYIAANARKNMISAPYATTATLDDSTADATSVEHKITVPELLAIAQIAT
jgi:hypothetical protein